MRELRLLAFQLREFAANRYFGQLLLSATLASIALQWLILQAAEPLAGARELAWIRGGAVGAWSTASVAVGMLGFQRFQGTLVHLVQAPIGVLRSLLPLLTASTVFGLLAFPLAAAAALVVGLPVRIRDADGFLVSLGCFALGSAALASAVAVLFILTPNAITYEPLIAVPVVLLAGVFGFPDGWAPLLQPASQAIPIGPAVQGLGQAVLGRPPAPAQLAIGVGASLLWFGVAWLALRLVMRRVRRDGSLEVL